MVGLRLGLVLDAFRRDLLRVEPSAVVEFAAEAAPGLGPVRVETRHGGQVGRRLRLQAVLLAPEGELPMGIGRLWGPPPPRLVHGEPRRHGAVAVHDLAHRLGGHPTPAVGDQAHHPSGRSIPRIDRHGRCQVLEPLGVHAVGLAPDGQLEVGPNIAAGPGRRGLVLRPIGGREAEQSGTDQDDGAHRDTPRFGSVTTGCLDSGAEGRPARLRLNFFYARPECSVRRWDHNFAARRLDRRVTRPW